MDADFNPVARDPEELISKMLSYFVKAEQDPESKVFSASFTRRVTDSLTSSTPKADLWKILIAGERVLQTYRGDLTWVGKLLAKAVQFISFDELKTAISPQKLEEGLQSPSHPIQLLCLAYLYKASDTPSGAAFVGASPSLTHTLITLWLSTESTEVAECALEAIVALLKVDQVKTVTVVKARDKDGEAKGQGLFWRRLFHYSEIYKLFFEWTSPSGDMHDLKNKKGVQMMTISQGRLFDFIVRVANLEWTEITTSRFPQIEGKYFNLPDKAPQYNGILQYAALHMIDTSDILMDVLRQDFFARLINTMEDEEEQSPPPEGLLEAIKEDAGLYDEDRAQPGGLNL